MIKRANREMLPLLQFIFSGEHLMRYRFSIKHVPHSPCSSSEKTTPWAAVIIPLDFFSMCLPESFVLLTPSLEAAKIQIKSLDHACVMELFCISNY